MNEILFYGQVISLALSIPAIFLALGVIDVFKISFSIKPKNEYEWLILGIVIGFIGTCADNFYWFWWWISNFLNIFEAERAVLLKYGVFTNIFFRQACTIIAAYCHLRGAVTARPEIGHKLSVAINVSTITSLLFVSLLLGSHILR